MMPKLPIRRARGGGVTVELSSEGRDLVRTLVEGYRDLLGSDRAADDPAVARLSPTAYVDDPLRDIAFDERHASELERERADAIETVLRTIDATRLTQDEADAWMRTCNDLRLVIGTRLQVTEETVEQDFAADPAAAAAFEEYAVLSWLVELLVRARPV